MVGAIGASTRVTLSVSLVSDLLPPEQVRWGRRPNPLFYLPTTSRDSQWHLKTAARPACWLHARNSTGKSRPGWCQNYL